MSGQVRTNPDTGRTIAGQIPNDRRIAMKFAGPVFGVVGAVALRRPRRNSATAETMEHLIMTLGAKIREHFIVDQNDVLTEQHVLPSVSAYETLTFARWIIAAMPDDLSKLERYYSG